MPDLFVTQAPPTRAITKRLAQNLTKIINSTFYLTTCIIAISLLSVGNALAMDLPDSSGKEFWLMFNDNIEGDQPKLFITGNTPTSGIVEVPGLSFSTPFNVTAGLVTTVSIPIPTIVRTSDTIEAKGVHIIADEEVTVYGLNRRQFTSDAFLGLPMDILGTDYLTLGYENTDVVNASQFGIVATENGTTVTITPSVSTGSRPGGTPYDITLNTGQTYQLQNTAVSPNDLSGTSIQSDLPIAVFAGHKCANIPDGALACDHLVEQMPPTTTWGQDFVTLPLATRTRGDTFRVMASEDTTEVLIDGVLAAALDRGKFFETILTTGSEISANKPVLVAQYSNGTTFDDVTSDPFESLVPPFEQFLASYTITTPASGFRINFVNIVAPAAAVGAVNLDGVPVPASDFTPIGSSGFFGAQIPVALGSHNLDAPIPFGITAYGFDEADSYGYPGGLGLSEIAQLNSLILAPPSAVNPVNTEHCVTATATDENTDPLFGIRVDFDVAGVNPTDGFAFTDEAGVADFCYTGTNIGLDSIAAFVGQFASNTATKEWVDSVIERCDVNLDGFISRTDISLIMARRNQPATAPEDPADADGNGVINANDARQCTLQCTNFRCQEEDISL